MFKIGEKVVCINALDAPPNTIILNEIYTIIAFKNTGGLLLKECYNGEKFGAPFFYGFKPERFRKLDHNFAEELLAEIAEEIENEELVSI